MTFWRGRIPRRALVLCALALHASVSAQEQATFSASVNTVATYATVFDVNGSFVPRLSAKDFEIKDDGKTRPVTLFGAGSLPITIVVLFDDSASMRESRPSTKVATTAFIERLGPNDRATVGIFSRSVRILGGLTSDRAELLKRLDVEAPLVAGTAIWDGINAAMSVLEEERGRRVVLVVTDGDDNSSEVDPRELASRAARDGVMIYAVGIRGGDGRMSKGLRDLAAQTGGAFLELRARDNLRSAFQRVVDELRNQYVLGFSLEVLDGREHRLEVKSKRYGVTVRARRSYVASPAGVRF
jgi:Ca-activated chloride channel homolog